MVESKGDFWEIYKELKTLRVIPTNGYFKTNGELVMGAGLALSAKRKHPYLPKILGEKIKESGNIVYIIEDLSVASFPTKHVFWEDADLQLIERSANRLHELTLRSNWDIVVLPMVGCGKGNLEWAKVKPILQKCLPESMYIVVTPENEE